MKTAECIQTRTVLWWMLFTGDAIGFTALTNIVIAIVAMVNTDTAQQSTASVCYPNITLLDNGNLSFTEDKSLHNEDDKFDWDEHQQSLVLTAEFWVAIFIQIFGGIPAQKLGGKIIFGSGIFLLCITGTLIPVCARLNFYLLIILLISQGIITCFAWPAAAVLIAKWVPPNERSTFSAVYKGKSAGLALQFPLCGQLIYWFGWPSVFYFTGIVGTMWFIMWLYLVYDSPNKHPRISSYEREFILQSLGDSVCYQKMTIPWKSILTSVPLWLLLFTVFGNIWCVNILIIQLPKYVNRIHGKNIRMTGLITGIPHTVRFLSSLSSSPVFDWLLSTSIMSRTNVRKTAVTICCLGEALFMSCLAFSGCNFYYAVVFMVLSMACSGTDTAGQLASLVDLSPNFAGVLAAIFQTIIYLSTFGSVFVPGIITYKNQTLSAWQMVFLISALIALIPSVFYIFFGTAELQDWNSPKNKTENKQVYEETQKALCDESCKEIELLTKTQTI